MNTRHTLAAALALAFAVGPAAAQGSRELDELRQELQRLRQEVAVLKQQQQQQQQQKTGAAPADASGWGERVQQLELKQKDAVVAGDVPGSFRLPGSETSLRFYGYAEAHALHDIRSTAPGDHFSNLMEQPLDGSGAPKGSTRFTAQASRFGFDSSTPTGAGAFTTKLEMDFYAYCGSDCNRNRLRLRHAYGEYAGWLVGQTWSTFMDLDNTTETIDFNAQLGVPFSRRTQVRYTWGNPSAGVRLSFALEDPEDQFGGGSSGERVPHLVARYDQGFNWGGFNLRVLSHEKRDAGGARKRGQGVGAGGSLKLGDLGLLVATVARVDGDFDNMIGSNGYRFDGSKFLFDRHLGFALGWAKSYGDAWRTNLSFEQSRAHVDAEFLALGDANRRLRQLHAGVIYTPLKNVELGAELVWGRRDTFAGASGRLSRIDVMGRYSF